MTTITRYVSRLRRWRHRNIRTGYSFSPKKGTERYLYKCPFCETLVHEPRFTALKIYTPESRIMLYGGYRGIKVLKATLSPEMQERVIAAVKEKLKWLSEKLGGEELWLKSKSAWIRDVPSSSFLTPALRSKPLKISVAKSSGVLKSVGTGSVFVSSPTRQLKPVKRTSKT